MRQKPSSNDRKTGGGRDFKGGNKGAAGKGFGGKREDDRRPGGGFKASGRREDDRGSDGPARFKREDKTGGQGRFGDREDSKRPYKKDDRRDSSFGKPDREKRSFGDKDSKSSYKRNDDKGYKADRGERKPFEDRGEKRPYQKREDSGRSFDKSDRGERKSFDDRNEKRPFKRREDNDKPERKRFDGDGDRKPSFRKNDGERSFDRPERKDKRFGDREDKKPFRKDGKKDDKDGDKPKRPGRERFEDQDLSFGKNKGRNAEEKKPRKKDFDRTEGKEGENNEVKPKLSLKKIEKAPEDFTKAFPLGDRKVSGPFRKQFAEEQEAEKAGKLKRARKPKESAEAEEIKEMTLNKYIAHSGTCSRRDAAEMVKQGKVKINGELALDPGYRVQPYDVVTIAGKKLTPQRNRVYILLNKPKGFLTTTEDPEDRKTVMDLVNPEDAGVERLFPVGRLDRNTTGLILLTNDGDLAQKLSHPSYEIKKVYQVSLNKPLTKTDFDKVVNGVELEDGVANVDALSYLDTKDELGLEIHSGRNRIVRRIFEALGYEVDKLDRVMYAGLTKKNLPRGKWRFLEEKEVILLKHFKS